MGVMPHGLVAVPEFNDETRGANEAEQLAALHIAIASAVFR